MKTLIIEDTARIEEVIRSCRVCFVGLTEPDGSPYVLPMSFGYDDGTFYFHSGKGGKKAALIRPGVRVCITLSSGDALIYQHPEVACSYSMVARSVICQGEVEMIDDRLGKADALNRIMRFYTGQEFSYSIPALDHVQVWKVKPEEICCKSFGNRAKMRKPD